MNKIVYESINDILKPKSKEEIDKIPFKTIVLNSNSLLIHKIRDELFFAYNLYFELGPYGFNVHWGQRKNQEYAALDFKYKDNPIEINQYKDENFIRIRRPKSDEKIYSFKELVNILNKIYG
jgi:hypothetical protein